MAHFRLTTILLLSGLLASASACDKETDPAPQAVPVPSVAPPPAEPEPAPVASAPEPAKPEPQTEQADAGEGEAAGGEPDGKTKTQAVRPKFVRGPAVSGTGFSVWLQSSSFHRAGKPSSVQAVLAAKEPYKCNEKYPYKFKPNSADVSFASTTIKGMSVTPKRSSMRIGFTPKAPGKAKVSGVLSFSVCTADQCLIEKKPLSISVPVL